MATDRRSLINKKACARCSTHKRRCDKAQPGCGLCTRLRQRCIYELQKPAYCAPTPLLSPRSDVLLSPEPSTPSRLKQAISRKLNPLTPEESFSVYCKSIEPLFPIISISEQRCQFSLAWDEITLDAAILCLSIILLSSSPPSSSDDGDGPCEFRSLYIYTKSALAASEVLGINSILIVQSRILVNFFEVIHGFYPTAYISIGATVRAADALEVHPSANDTSFTSPNGEERNQKVTIWSAIVILDRYIAVESGKRPPLTRDRSKILNDFLKPAICPTLRQDQDQTSLNPRLSRVLEASSLLDKIHTTLNNPTVEYNFNLQEITLTVHTLANLETILIGEIGDGVLFYSGGFSLCNTALLLAFENGAKLPPSAEARRDCHRAATSSLISILSTISRIVEPFTLESPDVDFNLITPFVTFLVYKVAANVTGRLLIDNSPDEKIRDLKILRKFLMIMGERWLGCRRYLSILNEDTTPRTLKALDQQ